MISNGLKLKPKNMQRKTNPKFFVYFHEASESSVTCLKQKRYPPTVSKDEDVAQRCENERSHSGAAHGHARRERSIFFEV